MNQHFLGCFLFTFFLFFFLQCVFVSRSTLRTKGTSCPFLLRGPSLTSCSLTPSCISLWWTSLAEINRNQIHITPSRRSLFYPFINLNSYQSCFPLGLLIYQSLQHIFLLYNYKHMLGVSSPYVASRNYPQCFTFFSHLVILKPFSNLIISFVQIKQGMWKKNVEIAKSLRIENKFLHRERP